MKKLALVPLTIIFLLLISAIAFAAPVGKITNLEGKVDVLKTGKNVAGAVSLGDPVDVGDIYRAKSTSKAEITFVNNNFLRIASNTRVEIKEYMVEGDKSSGIAKLHRGKVQVIAAEDLIKKAAAFAEGNKFEVHTPNAVAGIRGTNMVVFHERGLTGCLFVSGKGYLYNPAAPAKVVPVTAGNISFITSPAALPTPPTKASESEIARQVTAVTIPPKTTVAQAGTAAGGIATIVTTQVPAVTTDVIFPAASAPGTPFAQPQFVQWQQQFPQQQQLNIVPPVTAQAPDATRLLTDIAQPAPISPPTVTGTLPNPVFEAYNPNYSPVDPTSPVLKTEGTLTGNLSGTPNQAGNGLSVTFAGTYSNPNSRPIIFSPMQGSMAGGGRFYGFLGGIKGLNNSFEGRALALQIVSDTQGGYLAGYLASGSVQNSPITGTFYPNPGTWATTPATLTATNMNSTLFQPSQLTGNLEAFGYAAPIGGDIKGNAEFTFINLKNQNWGTWLATSGGTYTAAPSTQWKAAAGGPIYDISNQLAGYQITNFNGLDWTNNRVYGIAAGRSMSQNSMITFNGDFLGTYDPANSTWQATSLGAFTENPLMFFNSIDTDLAFNDNLMNWTPDGVISAYMGGTQSLWGAQDKSIPFTIIGKYLPSSTPAVKNHYWSQDVTPLNAGTGKAVTYDDGTYYGFLSGIDRTVQKSVEGRLSALYIDPTGKAGILKGTFDGVIHPDISMWEADGTKDRFQLNDNIGVTPGALPTAWYTAEHNYLNLVNGPALYDNPNSRGLFLDANKNIVSAMNSRGDQLSYASFANDPGFGIWQMDSWGAYNPSNITDKLVLIFNQRWADPNGYGTGHTFRIDAIASWGAGKIAGPAIGIGAGLENSWTIIAAGETLGAFNDYPATTFGAYATGAWLRTERFLSILDPLSSGYALNKTNLESLGFPTTKRASLDLSGTLPGPSGSSININNVRLFGFGTQPNDLPNVWATAPKASTTDGISGTLSGDLLPNTGFFTLTNSNETAYTKFAVTGAGYVNVSSFGAGDGKAPYAGTIMTGSWLGEIDGIGAVLLDSGSYDQGTWRGASAGTFSTSSGDLFSTTFSGSTSGLFYPSTFISHITTDTDNVAHLYSYNGTDYLRDGYLKGMAAGDPLPFWGSTKSTPSRFDMLGVYITDAIGTPPPPPESQQTAMTNPDHVFRVQIFPKNYKNPAKPYTTTDGGSYRGYIAGAHRGVNAAQANGSTVWSGPVEGSITGVYIDPQQNAGILLGRFGGIDKGYLDAPNKAWWADGTAYTVPLGTTNMLPENLNTNISSTSFDFSSPTSAGQFTNSMGSYITMATNLDRTFNSSSFWINDVPNMGGWVSEFVGKYGTNYPYGGFDSANPAPDGWIFGITGAAPETGKYIGISIQGGEYVQDQLVAGSQQWTNRGFKGNAAGYWADINTIVRDSYTGIMVGKVDGTFDPATLTVQAVMAGSWLETNKFLELAADETGRKKLQDLNIPSVIVGSATLTQQDANPYLSGVRIDNAQFFSTGNGGKPIIWAAGSASGGMSGNYSGNPITQTVTLAGSGLTANATMAAWENSKWLATITNGQGTVVGSTYTNPINFSGAGAGKITPNPTNPNVGSFSGTASGIVK